MSTKQEFALFKFGESEHIESFVNEGLLHMNTLRYFRDLEAKCDRVRPDRDEGSTWCIQANKAAISMKPRDAWIKVGTILGPIRTTDGREDITNVFCMFALHTNPVSEPLVHEKNFEFGDTFAVLTNPVEFLRRVNEAAVCESLSVHKGLVEYFNSSTYHGPMGPFRKFSEFAYQSEFRIAIEGGKNEPLRLKIGSLLDIAKIGTLAEINNIISIHPPHSGTAPAPPPDSR